MNQPGLQTTFGFDFRTRPMYSGMRTVRIESPREAFSRKRILFCLRSFAIAFLRTCQLNAVINIFAKSVFDFVLSLAQIVQKSVTEFSSWKTHNVAIAASPQMHDGFNADVILLHPSHAYTSHSTLARCGLPPFQSTVPIFKLLVDYLHNPNSSVIQQRNRY